jgi:hypothetical protein
MTTLWYSRFAPLSVSDNVQLSAAEVMSRCAVPNSALCDSVRQCHSVTETVRGGAAAATANGKLTRGNLQCTHLHHPEQHCGRAKRRYQGTDQVNKRVYSTVH